MTARRVLLVKLADLGDAVLLTAAVDALERALPGCELDLLVSTAAAPVFEHDPRVSRVWVFDRKLIEGRRAFTPRSLYLWARLLWALGRRGYDAVILAHHLTTALGTIKLASVALATRAPIRAGVDNGRGAFLNRRYPDPGFGAAPEGEYWVRLVGLLAGKEVEGRIGLVVPAAARERARELVPAGTPRPLVAVHHGQGGWISSRAWTAEEFARVADALHERTGGTVLLIGGPEEHRAAEEVAKLMRSQAPVLAGRTDVPTLAALLEMCDLYVGPDSGPMHVASAVGTPVVSLWGPTNEAAWAPSGRLGAAPAFVIRAPDRPSPWVYVGHRMGEPHKKGNLGGIEPERVVTAALRLLEEGKHGD